MTLRICICLAVLAALSACARKPEKIMAAAVPTAPYQKYPCAALGAQRLRLTDDLAQVSEAQRAAARGDLWGVLILGLPVASLAGQDREAEIAQLKGELAATEAVITAKPCL